MKRHGRLYTLHFVCSLYTLFVIKVYINFVLLMYFVELSSAIPKIALDYKDFSIFEFAVLKLCEKALL